MYIDKPVANLGIVLRVITECYDDLYNSAKIIGRHSESNIVYKSRKSYSFIPSPPYVLTELLEFLTINKEFIKSRSNINICDFGCGNGSFMMPVSRYLSYLFPGKIVTPTGVDFNKDIIPIRWDFRIIQKNFFTISKSTIKRFNIIYAYNPLYKDGDNAKLLRKLTSSCKKGAIIFFTPASDAGYLKELGFKQCTTYGVLHYFIKK
jgi:2-polyprenyl-3-methyl-5-hydroxy-6-metoxy-1,4-benzoquinol methylase